MQAFLGFIKDVSKLAIPIFIRRKRPAFLEFNVLFKTSHIN